MSNAARQRKYYYAKKVLNLVDVGDTYTTRQGITVKLDNCLDPFTIDKAGNIYSPYESYKITDPHLQDVISGVVHAMYVISDITANILYPIDYDGYYPVV